MASEYLKYNPKNIKPEFFLTPPTSPLNNEFKYLASQVSQALLFSKRHKPYELGIGAEFEVIFFSSNDDPGKLRRGNYLNGHSYSVEHQLKMERLKDWSGEISSRPRFIPCESIGKLSIEYRTKKADLDGYFSAVEELKDEVQRVSHTLDICPIAHSQHLHVSLLTSGGKNVTANRYLYGDGKYSNYTFYDFFKRVSPLVLLPEEIRNFSDPLPNLNFNKNRGRRGNIQRAEFRMLSSEYACDPFLNILLSLYALHIARNLKSELSDFRETRILDHPRASKQLAKDRTMIKLFGEQTIQDLSTIVSHYEKVSRRQITVADLTQNWRTIETQSENMSDVEVKRSYYQRLVSLFRGG